MTDITVLPVFVNRYCAKQREKDEPLKLAYAHIFLSTLFHLNLIPKPLPFFVLWFLFSIIQWKKWKSTKNREGQGTPIT